MLPVLVLLQDAVQSREAVPVLPEVTVTATRAETDAYRAPRSTIVITAEDIRRKGARTVPEILREECGIHVQETNLGGGSPIVRGLIGPQVLILVDGVRLNNATTRRGANQYLNTIDPAIVERIEVVRGISSVLYGSDALGGVIQVFTRRRHSFGPGVHADGALLGRFDTAADARSGSLRGDGNVGDFGWAGAGSLRSFSDLRGGNDTGTQDSTGYGPEGDLFAAWSLRLPRSREVSFTAQYNDQRHVPRTDRLEGGPGGPPQDQTNVFDTQRRELYAMRWDDREKGPIADEAGWTVSLQRQLEEQSTRRLGTNHLDEGYYKDRTFGVQGHARRALDGSGHTLSWGAELYFDEVLSARRRTDLVAGTAAAIQPAYPDGANYRSFGVYLQDEIEASDTVDVRAGVRWSQFALDADLPAPIGHIRGDFDKFTGSLDAGWQVSEPLRLVAGVAQGFRAPNLDDTTAFQVTNNVLVDAPNPNVDPEVYRGLELGGRWREGDAAANLVYHFTRIYGLVQRVPGTFQGQPVNIRENVGRAYIEGIEADASMGLGDGFSAFGNAFWTVGVVTSGNDEPARLVPPLSGTTGLRWEDLEAGRFWASLALAWARHQRRLNPEDEADIRIGPDGTPGYGIAHLRTGWRVSQDAELFVAVENIGDVDYRVHGSGLNGPGRNVVGGFELRF